MASYHAIAATGRAILRVLEDACPRDVFPSAVYDFLPADASAAPPAEGVTLHLYRVAPDPARRSLPPAQFPPGKRQRPAVSLNLYYLVSAWSASAETQQRLLGCAIQALAAAPVLTPELLNTFGPEPQTFRPGELVELTLEPLSLQDMGLLWAQVRPQPGLAAAYLARGVVLETEADR